MKRQQARQEVEVVTRKKFDHDIIVLDIIIQSECEKKKINSWNVKEEWNIRKKKLVVFLFHNEWKSSKSNN